MVGGIIIQILWFGFFVVVALIFNLRINKEPTARSRDMPCRKHMHTIYFASVLIMVRSIVRTVEFIQGDAGYIISHEIFLYVFDAVLMLSVMAVFNVIHPSEVYALLRGGKMTQGGLKLYTVNRSTLSYN